MEIDNNQKNLHLLLISDAPLRTALHAGAFMNISKELQKIGWKVTLFSPDSRTIIEKINGVEVQFMLSPDAYLIRQIIYHILVLNHIRKNFNKIDFIVFNEMATPWIIPLQLFKKITLKKKPFIILDTRTLPMLQENKSSLKDRVRANYSLLMNKICNRWADGRTTITRRMAAALQVPEKKLLGIWTSGVELELFARAKSIRNWRYDDGKVHLIYIGSMHHVRNLMTLCKAVVRANQSGMSFHLLLIGSGDEKVDLERFAKEYDYIDVFSQIPQDQIPDWLAKAHIGVLPFPDRLIFQVSSPIKLFEYMASGLAILATRIGCHTDVIGDNRFAFWAEDSNEDGIFFALEEVWKNRDRLQDIGALAAEAAIDWTWTASAKNFESALKNAL